MKKLPKLSIRIRNVFLRVAVQLFLVIVVVAASIVFSNSVAIERIYTFAEIVNMESIRLKLDEVDPFSYEYFKQLALISDTNSYLREVFDEAQNVVYSNSAKFLYSGEFSGDIDQVYAAGEVVRTMEWLREDVTLDKFSYGENDTSYVRYMVQLKNGDALRIWLPSFQVQRNAEVAAILLTAFALISGIATAVLILFFSRNFSHPVAEMSEMAESMANLDFGKKCKHYRQTDVQNLGKNINILSESLSQTLDELQDKNEKLTEELEHSALIDESRKSFIANVSHEFKTPLASIMGYVTLMQDPELTQEDKKEYISKIFFNIDKLNDLTENILRLSKLDNQNYSSEVVSYRLDEQIRESIVLLEPKWSKKDISFDINMPELVYSGQRELLFQVWTNIISNAIKFSDNGGSIMIFIRQSRGYIEVVISDDGIGMDEETQSHIFDKFYQGDTSRRSQGNGLGLALCKKILDKCGGKIFVTSEPGNGSVFIVQLETEEIKEKG